MCGRNIIKFIIAKTTIITSIMDRCALPGCSKPIKNWRTYFCCLSHGGKYSALHLPKLVPKTKGVKSKKEWVSTIPYKDWTPQQKGKWVAYVSARQKRIKQATPKWADLSAIKEVYIRAQQFTKETGTPHEVDHIIPIQGKLVCGLHVPANLQILTEKENQSKNAKFII